VLDERWQALAEKPGARVLVVRLDNIGDVIMLGPALRAIRANLPRASITLLATPGGSQAAPLLPWIDDVMVHRVLWQDITGAWPLDPGRELALVDEIRQRGFDAAIIFTSFTQSPHPPAFVCYLAGIPLRVAQSKEFGGGLLTQWVRPLGDEEHQVDRNLRLLSAASFELAGAHLEVRIPVEAQARADALLASVGIEPGQPFIALAPGASAAARRYDPGRFGSVAAALAGQPHPVTRAPLTVALLGSQREVDLVGGMAVANRPGVVSLAGQTSVPELAGVINRAALVLANNSGPLHLADALNRPMVIMYSGAEWETQWQPRGAPATLLRRPTPCSPCFAFTCPYGMECLDFAPAEVVEAALTLLRRTHEEAKGLADLGAPVGSLM
jgi:ADP-heptose:LPS heptosyltransferase